MSAPTSTEPRSAQVAVAHAADFRADLRSNSAGRLGRILRSRTALAAVTVVLASVATWRGLDLQAADWLAPFDYDSDAIQIAQWMQTIFLHGWYEHEPLLGAPFGQNYHDWGWADHLGFLIAVMLNPLTRNPFLTENIIFVSGFPAAALTALWFFRRIGVGRAFSVALAVLYALAPYHFFRAEYHLFLGTYWPLPLIAGVAWMILRGEPLWRSGPRRLGRLPLPSRRSVFVLAAAVLVALDGVYYAFFSAALLAFSALTAAVRHRDGRRLLAGLTAIVAICVTVVADVAPDVLYTRHHGTDLAALIRTPGQSEDLALKLTELLLPVPLHRIPLLARVRDIYTAAFPLPGENPSLGTVGAIGLVVLLVVAAVACARGAAARWAGRPSMAFTRSTDLALLGVFLLILSTVGGLSSIVALVTDGLRGWDRSSILIQLLAFGGFGLWGDQVFRMLWRRSRRRGGAARPWTAVLLPVVATTVMVGGYFDQVVPSDAPRHAAVQQAFAQDARTVAGITRVFGARAAVLQLPPRNFPESGGPAGTYDSDQLRFMLHSSTLRWSGGGIKGRPESDWVAGLATHSLRLQLAAASAAGFSAVMLDRQYYGSDVVRSVDAEFVKLVGIPRVHSADGRFAVYDLRGAAARLAPGLTPTQRRSVAFAMTRPIDVTLTQDPRLGYSVPSLFQGYRPRIQLQNPRSSPVSAVISVNGSYVNGSAAFRVLQGSRSVGTLVLSSAASSQSIWVRVPPGTSYLSLAQTAGVPLPANPPVDAVLLLNFLANDGDVTGLVDRIG